MGSLPTCTFSFSIIRGMADFCCLINWFRQVSIPINATDFRQMLVPLLHSTKVSMLLFLPWQ